MKQIIKIFKALSDETRLHIYLLLSQEALCVCELVNILNMEQSRVSHSLRILREAELVDDKREGKWIVYSVNREMLDNKIIQGLSKELKLSTADLENIAKCKREKIRSRF